MLRKCYGSVTGLTWNELIINKLRIYNLGEIGGENYSFILRGAYTSIAIIVLPFGLLAKGKERRTKGF
ncbi:MAG TPA: hypothetical protein PKX24_06115, partial [Candidatus Cloacimonas acidaminovorans]|nr:hypothetical protein [Candidatus Cloacimonas acidaminovorans]